MISSLLFINLKGEILIYRIYKDDVARQEAQQFCYMVATKAHKETPVVLLDGTSFVHVSHKDIILLATSKSNLNVAMTFEFLYQLLRICKAYFGGDVTENEVKKHFVLIYEILDEVMDYGLPQITDFELLRKFIQEGGIVPEALSDVEKLRQLTNQATGVNSWRPPNIKHKKNELYLDVIESVNLLMSVKGTILKADVIGKVTMNSKLSGMPECQFGMNDKLLMEKESKKSADKGINIDDLKFHQCVRLGKFDKERKITFTPPDGTFDLMTYRISENINMPFKMTPVVTDVSANRFEVRLALKSIFESSIIAQNVVIKVPCPKHTARANCSSMVGRARYEPDQGAIVWRIKKYGGEFECTLTCDVHLGSTTSEKKWVRPPISIDFKVPMFTASGLRVRFLRVMEAEGYKPVKWIRYETKAGEYQHRL
jgi:AP-2 complex subunit mu-1